MIDKSTKPYQAISVLSYFFRYSLGKFPGKTLSFVGLKIVEFCFQLAIAALLALMIQAWMTDSLPAQLEGINFIFENISAQLSLQSATPVILALLAILVLLGAFVSYLSRRILTRIAVETEYDLSAELINSAAQMSFTQYKNLASDFAKIDDREILKLVQQNARLVGIVCRNLVASIFSALQLIVVFIVLMFLGSGLAPLLLIATFIASCFGLLWLFKIGINHSVNFPMSAGRAANERRKLLGQLSTGLYRDKRDDIVEGYFANPQIKSAMKHYEDRFKIIDQGNLVTSLVTGLAFIILIIALFSADKGVDIFKIIAVIFIGNILFRALQQLSGFFVIIGRLYTQVQEIWSYRKLTFHAPDNGANTSSHTGDAMPDLFGTIVDSQNAKQSFSMTKGSVFALCQYDQPGVMAMYNFLLRCEFEEDMNFKTLSTITVAGLDQLGAFAAQQDDDKLDTVQKKFDGIMKRYKGELKPGGKDAAWLVYAYAQLGRGLIVISFDSLALIPVDLLKRLLRVPSEGVLIFYGRSPIPALRGQGDNIKTTILFGNSLKVMKTKDALTMTGQALRDILQVQQKTSAASSFEADLE